MAPRSTSKPAISGAVTPEDVSRPSTPPMMAPGDYSAHIFAQLSEIQRCMGGMEKEQANQRALFDKLEDRLGSHIHRAEDGLAAKITKVDGQVQDLVQVYRTSKVVFYVVAFIAAAFLTGAGWVAKEVWDISKPLIMKQIASGAGSQPATQPTAGAVTSPPAVGQLPNSSTKP